MFIYRWHESLNNCALKTYIRERKIQQDLISPYITNLNEKKNTHYQFLIASKYQQNHSRIKSPGSGARPKPFPPEPKVKEAETSQCLLGWINVFYCVVKHLTDWIRSSSVSRTVGYAALSARQICKTQSCLFPLVWSHKKWPDAQYLNKHNDYTN